MGGSLLSRLVVVSNRVASPSDTKGRAGGLAVALQDVLGQTVMLQFMQTRRSRTAVPTTVHCDHLVQARVEGVIDLVQSLAENT